MNTLNQGDFDWRDMKPRDRAQILEVLARYGISADEGESVDAAEAMMLAHGFASLLSEAVELLDQASIHAPQELSIAMQDVAIAGADRLNFGRTKH